MRRIILYLFCIAVICTGKTVQAQDIHYSQFFNSPLNLNPALTGMFKGDYRFVANLRNQWASVTVPFTTFSLGADAQNPFHTRNLGLGAFINHDQAGDSRFKTVQVNFTGAYIKSLNSDSTLVISGGLLAGVTFRSLTSSALNFDQQYDGYQYDPQLPTGENLDRESRVYPNFNIGVSLYQKMAKRGYILGGISWHNLQKPKQSFFTSNDIKLDRKFNIHAEGAYTVADQWDIIPSVNFQFQGKYSEVVPGVTARYVLTDEKGLFRAVHAGGWFRVKDAFYVLGGIEFDNWKAAVSYDINTSDLVPASNKRGAFELSLIYILDSFNPKRISHRICPNYL